MIIMFFFLNIQYFLIKMIHLLLINKFNNFNYLQQYILNYNSHLNYSLLYQLELNVMVLIIIFNDNNQVMLNIILNIYFNHYVILLIYQIINKYLN
jgi:hypothetical protein